MRFEYVLLGVLSFTAFWFTWSYGRAYGVLEERSRHPRVVYTSISQGFCADSDGHLWAQRNGMCWSGDAPK